MNFPSALDVPLKRAYIPQTGNGKHEFDSTGIFSQCRKMRQFYRGGEKAFHLAAGAQQTGQAAGGRTRDPAFHPASQRRQSDSGRQKTAGLRRLE